MVKVATSMGSRGGESRGGDTRDDTRGGSTRGETRGDTRRLVGYARVLQRVVAEREKISRELRRVMDARGSLGPTTAAARDGVAYARHAPARQLGRIPGAKG